MPIYKDEKDAPICECYICKKEKHCYWVYDITLIEKRIGVCFDCESELYKASLINAIKASGRKILLIVGKDKIELDEKKIIEKLYFVGNDLRYGKALLKLTDEIDIKNHRYEMVIKSTYR